MSSSSQPPQPEIPEEDTGGGDRTDTNTEKNSNRSELEYILPFCHKAEVTLTLPCRISLAMRDVIRSGRGIRRLVTLCGTIRQLVKESDRRLLNVPDDEDEEDEDAEPPQPPQDPQELAQR